jgi:hypothetical protein
MKSKIESAFEKIIGGLPTTAKVTFERINLSQLKTLQQKDTSISIVSKDRQTNKILLYYYKYPPGILFLGK